MTWNTQETLRRRTMDREHALALLKLIAELYMAIEGSAEQPPPPDVTNGREPTRVRQEHPVA